MEHVVDGRPGRACNGFHHQPINHDEDASLGRNTSDGNQEAMDERSSNKTDRMSSWAAEKEDVEDVEKEALLSSFSKPNRLRSGN